VFSFNLIASADLVNLVVNPGFETGNFAGWTQSGNTDFTGVAGSAALPPSSFGAFFGPQGSLGFLSQNLVTDPGASYDLTFWLLNQGGTPNQFQASWNGSVITGSLMNNAAAFDYTQFTFQGLLATGSSTVLEFGFRQDPSFWFLDDVSVTRASVPEPLSSLWLGLTLAGMLGAKRLQKHRLDRKSLDQ
jgi:flagellin